MKEQNCGKKGRSNAGCSKSEQERFRPQSVANDYDSRKGASEADNKKC
jgi:hypothetical protein